MVVFAMIGIFLIKAAVDYNPRAAVGLDGALAKLVHRSYGPLALGFVAAGLSRVRALLAQRRPLPQDLSLPLPLCSRNWRLFGLARCGNSHRPKPDPIRKEEQLDAHDRRVD